MIHRPPGPPLYHGARIRTQHRATTIMEENPRHSSARRVTTGLCPAILSLPSRTKRTALLRPNQTLLLLPELLSRRWLLREETFLRSNNQAKTTTNNNQNVTSRPSVTPRRPLPRPPVQPVGVGTSPPRHRRAAATPRSTAVPTRPRQLPTGTKRRALSRLPPRRPRSRRRTNALPSGPRRSLRRLTAPDPLPKSLVTRQLI